MARGRVIVRRQRDGMTLVIAEAYDVEDRLVWSDNTGYSRRSHVMMLDAAAEVVGVLRRIEQMGNRLAWDWRQSVAHAPKL